MYSKILEISSHLGVRQEECWECIILRTAAGAVTRSQAGAAARPGRGPLRSDVVASECQWQ